MWIIHIFSLPLHQQFQLLHNSLPAGKQSPLLFLVQPLTAGIGFGLCFSSWLQQWESILLVCLSVTMIGVIICHKKMKPIARTLRELYIQFLFLFMFLIGSIWGEIAMNRLEPFYPDDVYQQLRVVLLEAPSDKPKLIVV